jgi:cysteine desulfurase family protein (TIGR01976 family)
MSAKSNQDAVRASHDFLRRRGEFPAMKRTVNGHPLAYLDGPGGTQVPQSVIDAVAAYYQSGTANAHGEFVTSRDTDRIVQGARNAMAALLNAESGNNIAFGANMTSLNFSLGKAIGRYLQPGDEILITQLDHEANRGPWLNLRGNNIRIREITLKPDGRLDYEDMERKINEKTRLLAIGWASNALGTVNDIRMARALTHRVGAWLLVDAVHYVPHFSVDVQSHDVDFLLCSTYKFYGPHVGLLYARTGILDQLPTDRLRTQDQRAPYCIETGTLNFAALAGVQAAVEYIASHGIGEGLRNRVVEGMQRIRDHEHRLAERLWLGLEKIPGLKFYGPPMQDSLRTPTLSFTLEGMTPSEVCSRLGHKGFCLWGGHFYAVRPIEVLGLSHRGGLVRVGVSLYNTEEEIERLAAELRGLVAGASR